MSENQQLKTHLVLPGKNESRGQIIIRAEKVTVSNDNIYFSAKAFNLPSNITWLCGNDDPFFYIERSTDSGGQGFVKVYQCKY